MDLCTYGAPLPLPAVAWLLSRAEFDLAQGADAQTPLGAIAGVFAGSRHDWRTGAQETWIRAFKI